jgi:hypothetical protein
MLRFEKLARFVTGSSCETNRRSIGIRVCIGLFVHTLFFVFALVFAGAGAGNAGATDVFARHFLPITASIFLVYIGVTLLLFINDRFQLAQYLAWSPLLLITLTQIIRVGAALLGVPLA